MANPSVTNIFTNNTTSDATQVNTNFTDLINAMTDGTRDFTIGTLVVNGAVTFKGNMTFGDASADSITVTGSVASTIAYSANATYNIGSSTLAPLSIYLGNGSNTMRLLGGTISASFTFTYPNAVPTITGQTMVFDTNSTASFRYPDKYTASKTSNYTATGDETVIPCSTSGAGFTVTLPAASTCTGKMYRIIKTSSDLNALTVDANGAETINGALTTVLYTQYECVEIVCDGSNWYIINRRIPETWAAYTPTYTGFGSVSNSHMEWCRRGSNVLVQGEVTVGVETGVEAQMTTPGGVTLTHGTATGVLVIGTFGVPTIGATYRNMAYTPGNAYFNFSIQNASFQQLAVRLGNDFTSSVRCTVFCEARVSNWEG